MSEFKAKFLTDIKNGVATALGEGVDAADVDVDIHNRKGYVRIANHIPGKMMVTLHKKKDQTNASEVQTAYEAIVEDNDGMLITSIEILMSNDFIVEDNLDGL